jgi:hypothetical protein
MGRKIGDESNVAACAVPNLARHEHEPGTGWSHGRPASTTMAFRPIISRPAPMPRP